MLAIGIGITNGALQAGQVPCFPAAASGALMAREHEGQVIGIGIAGDSRWVNGTDSDRRAMVVCWWRGIKVGS